MDCTVKSVKTFTLTLSAKEAQWLRDITRQPIPGYEAENSSMVNIRVQFHKALNPPTGE